MILPFESHRPTLADDVFVAPDATVLGRVTIAAGSSVWFGAVIRADGEDVVIGERTNLQDRTVVHIATDRHPTRVGDDVTVGHGAVLHACTVGNRVLVGIGAIVLDEARLDDDCMVGAGALVAPGMHVPSGHLAVGAPARVVRELRPAELAHLRTSAANYASLAQRYRGGVATPGR